MFRVRADFSEARQLALTLERASAVYPNRVVGPALREAAKPMLRVARQEVPVGKANIWTRRGGATRQDLRIKVVYLSNPVVFVGVSMARGRVGWRTHFITRPVNGGGRGKRIFTRGNDFIKRTYDRTYSGFVRDVGGKLARRAEAYLANRRYVR